MFRRPIGHYDAGAQCGGDVLPLDSANVRAPLPHQAGLYEITARAAAPDIRRSREEIHSVGDHAPQQRYREVAVRNGRAERRFAARAGF